MPKLRRILADPHSPRSLGARARRRRWETLMSRFPALAEMRVIDLGGEVASWRSAPVRPADLTIVNIAPQRSDDSGVRVVDGDACALPDAVRNETFDLVFSNSVIEHVGGSWRRRAFADSVARLADRHWVQTPYRYFPIEPHWLFPGFQFLPLRLRAEITRRWRPGRHIRALDGAVGSCLTVELLSRTEMRHLFPDSDLLDERIAGVTKSLIAVR